LLALLGESNKKYLYMHMHTHSLKDVVVCSTGAGINFAVVTLNDSFILRDTVTVFLIF